MGTGKHEIFGEELSNGKQVFAVNPTLTLDRDEVGELEPGLALWGVSEGDTVISSSHFVA